MASQSLDRVAVHVTTDKPLYKPGQTVRGRAILLNTATKKPYFHGLTNQLHVEFLNGRGTQITELKARVDETARGHKMLCAGFEWLVPEDQAGGDFVAKCKFMASENGLALEPVCEAGVRPFEIRVFNPPRLNLDLEWVKQAYGPGEQAAALLSVTRAEGGIPAGASVSAVASLDGEEINRSSHTLDAGGNCEIRFDLPNNIPGEGEGNLAVTVRDGGVSESTSKTIPIPKADKLFVDFFAEGGDLVPSVIAAAQQDNPFLSSANNGDHQSAACQQQRCYVSARTAKGKPADVEGEVFAEATGAVIGTFKTSHEGRGRFDVANVQLGTSYRARLTAPSGVKATYAVGTTVTSSAAAGAAVGTDAALASKAPNKVLDSLRAKQRWLRAVDDVTEPGQPLRVLVGPGASEVELHVHAGSTAVAGVQKVAASDKPTEVGVPLDAAAPAGVDGGVFLISLRTANDFLAAPLCERPVFVRPKNKVRVEMESIAIKHGGGLREFVEVAMRCVDAASGAPLSAHVAAAVSVVDDSVVKKVDKRERPPRIEAQALLENNVVELRDCGAYLDGSNASNEKLDLLLGTQGWRRFVYTWKADAPTDCAALNVNENIASNEELRQKVDRLVGALKVKPVPDIPPAPVLTRRGGGGRGGGRRRHGGWGGRKGGPPIDDSSDDDIDFDGDLDGMALEAEDECADKLECRGAMPMARDALFGAAPPPGAAMPMAMPMMAPVASAAPAGLMMQQQQQAHVPVKAAMLASPAQAPLLPQKEQQQPAAGAAKKGDRRDRLEMPVARMAKAKRRMSPSPPDEQLQQILAPPQLQVVRVYSYQAPGPFTGVRSEFPDTLFFDPVLNFDAAPQNPFLPAGAADSSTANPFLGRPAVSADPTAKKIAFSLADSVTSFEIRVDVVTASGALGEGTAVINATRPFYVEPKLPLELSAGDLATVPVAVCNGTKEPVTAKLTYKVGGDTAATKATKPGQDAAASSASSTASSACPLLLPASSHTNQLSLMAKQNARAYVDIATAGADAVSKPSKAHLNVAAEAQGDQNFADTCQRQLTVVPFGFPIEESFAGKIKADSSVSFSVPFPVGGGARGLKVQVSAATAMQGSISDALSGLVRQPYGCFEQTCNTAYPMLLALKYWNTHGGGSPAKVKEAKTHLSNGVKKMMGYEVKKDRAFEWFGEFPSSEPLSALGLYFVSDLLTVSPDSMKDSSGTIARVQQWLLGRRQSGGGFQRNKRALDDFGAAPPAPTNAYITYSLAATHAEGIDGEVDYVLGLARKEPLNCYVIALAALTAHEVGRTSDYKDLTQILVDKFSPSSSSSSSAFCAPSSNVGSITNSKGRNLMIETTALGALAMAKDPEAFGASAIRCADWLHGNCKNGRFGSTQGTVLALKAIIAVDAINTAKQAPGSLVISAAPSGGSPAAVSKSAELIFTDSTKVELDLGSDTNRILGSCSSENSMQLTLEMKGGCEAPFSVDVSYIAEKPVSGDKCAVALSTSLQANRVKEGETVDCVVNVQNRSADELGMVVAIVGIPAGLEARTDQLKEFVKEGRIAAFELQGAREIVLYWRGFAASGHPSGAQKTVPLSLMAVVPGRYRGPASRAYVYYDDDERYWVDPMEVAITGA